jgi:hypothetical protein
LLLFGTWETFALSASQKQLVKDLYSFLEKNVAHIHFISEIKGMRLARGAPQSDMQVAKLDGHRRIFGRVTQFREMIVMQDLVSMGFI